MGARAKKIAVWSGIAVGVWLAYLGISLLFLPSVETLKDRRASIAIKVKDWQGNYRQFILGPRNRYWTPSAIIPAEMKWAVILAEDSNFYRHEGIDVKAIKNAIKYDLEKRSLARGASTITQQVAKNVFLSREKSINRKVKEIVLAKRMEDELTKGRIVELYLNVFELGPMVYGIGHGSRYYFGKHPSQLTPRECSILAAMLPGPRLAYNPYRNIQKVVKRADMILGLLRRNGVLSEDEYRVALAESVAIGSLQRKVDESIRAEEAMPNRTSAVGPVLPEGGVVTEEGGAPREGAAAGEGASVPPADVAPEKTVEGVGGEKPPQAGAPTGEKP
jgi:monofunctional biosynthetic peptidoglycan transglycosylase